MLFSFQSPVSPLLPSLPLFRKLEKSGSFAGNFIISLPLLSVKYFFSTLSYFFRCTQPVSLFGVIPFSLPVQAPSQVLPLPLGSSPLPGGNVLYTITTTPYLSITFHFAFLFLALLTIDLLISTTLLGNIRRLLKKMHYF